MICKPYYWDKQHVNISPLVLMTDWLMAMHCSQKTAFHFLNVVNVHTPILSARNYFCGIFFDSHKCFQDIFLRRIRELKKTSLLRCFGEVFEMSLSMEIWLRHLRDISCRLCINHCQKTVLLKLMTIAFGLLMFIHVFFNDFVRQKCWKWH